MKPTIDIGAIINKKLLFRDTVNYIWRILIFIVERTAHVANTFSDLILDRQSTRHTIEIQYQPIPHKEMIQDPDEDKMDNPRFIRVHRAKMRSMTGLLNAIIFDVICETEIII